MDVIEEAKTHAPVLYSILTTAVPKSDKLMSLAFIIATLCQLTNRNLNLHLKMVACILYSGHCSKQVSFIFDVI